MILSLLQENLLRALSQTTRIISSRAQLPVLQNVLLSTEEGQLRVTTTSLENTESAWVGAKIDKEGALCVPARLLTEFVTTLPPETVRLAADRGSLSVACGGTQATIPGVPATEFPPVPSQKQTQAATLAKDDFCSALSLVLFAAATDEGRPLLTGVKIRSEEEGLLLAATDGYRLAVKRVRLLPKNDVDMVVPARALSEVVKVAIEEKEADKISFSTKEEGQLIFELGNVQIATRLIGGEYPGFDKIIPKTFTTRVHLEKDALARAVKSAAIFARDNANIVHLSVAGQKIIVSAGGAGVGENRVELPVEVNGEGGEIAFNSRFLLEYLANLPDVELLFEMTGSLNPGLFRPVKDDSLTHIIMPIRTAGEQKPAS